MTSHSPLALDPQSLGLTALEERGVDQSALARHISALQRRLQPASLDAAQRERLQSELIATECALDIARRYNLPAPKTSGGLQGVSDIFRQLRRKN